MPRKGSKRKKTRTHVKPVNDTGDPSAAKVPKSFVLRSGHVGKSASQLVKDVRKVMEPNTGTRLRERKRNRLRDFVAMSGPLGVTHMLSFSQPPAAETAMHAAGGGGEQGDEDEEDRLLDSETTLNLRLIRLPRGPTLSFKVLRYALARDLQRASRRPRALSATGKEFATGPLLILSGFGAPEGSQQQPELKLMTTIFQNMFPPIHVQTMPLSSARRVVLLSYNPTTKTIEFRHYLISVRQVGVSRAVRRIIDGSAGARATGSSSLGGASDTGSGGGPSAALTAAAKRVLDLGRASDISDYILRHEGLDAYSSAGESDLSDAGGGSASEGGESSDGGGKDEKRGRVTLPGDYVGRGNKGQHARGQKRAVKLLEIGPRMELGLIKVEEGVGEGSVLFHEIVHKTARDAKRLHEAHAERRRLAAQRRAEQQANVEAKRKAKDAVKGGAGADADDEGEGEDDDDEEDEIESAAEDYDYDAEHGLPLEEADPLDDAALDDVSEGESDGLSEDDDSASEQDEQDILDDDDDDEEVEVEDEGGESAGSGELEDEDDSDLSPIPYHSGESESEDDESSEEEAPRPKKRARFADEQSSSTSAALAAATKSKPQQQQKKRPSSVGFSQKGFKNFDAPRHARQVRGLAPQPRPAKKSSGDNDDGDDGDGPSWKQGRSKRGGESGSRGGRGASRGGTRGGGRGGRGSSRGGGSGRGGSGGRGGSRGGGRGGRR